MNQPDFAELKQKVESIFMNQIPFNKLLGMHVQTLSFDGAEVRVNMRDDLVGNFIHGILHGGVISSILDVTGGLTAFMSMLEKMADASDEEKLERLSRFGTIDLRVDYLRPGQGVHFIASGNVLRTGTKVAVTQMELHNDQGVLIAVGTGTYMVV